MLTLAIPLLHVSSADSAEAFYCGSLGFQLLAANRPDPAHRDPCYLVIRRDDAVIHLSSHSGDGVTGGVANIRTEDVDALYREFSAKSVPIAMAPTDQSWGTRELYVKDIDGNSVRFQQPLNG